VYYRASKFTTTRNVYITRSSLVLLTPGSFEVYNSSLIFYWADFLGLSIKASVFISLSWNLLNFISTASITVNIVFETRLSSMIIQQASMWIIYCSKL